jgi:hypothetical protein
MRGHGRKVDKKTSHTGVQCSIWVAQLVVMAYNTFYAFYVCNENLNWGKLEAYFEEIPQNQNISLKKTQTRCPPKRLTSYTNANVLYVILKWVYFKAYFGGNTPE